MFAITLGEVNIIQIILVMSPVPMAAGVVLLLLPFSGIVNVWLLETVTRVGCYGVLLHCSSSPS